MIQPVEDKVIKIKSSTEAPAAAGSIVTVLKEHGYAEAACIGAAAVSNAVKAYIISKKFLEPTGNHLLLDAGFDNVVIDGVEKTRIRFSIEQGMALKFVASGDNEIRIASKTTAKSAAASITKAFRHNSVVKMMAIGPASVNQAIKAFLITKGNMAPLGKNLCIDASFDTVVIDGEDKTRINMLIGEK